MIVGDYMPIGALDHLGNEKNKKKKGIFEFITAVKPMPGAPQEILTQDYGSDKRFVTSEAAIEPVTEEVVDYRTKGPFLKPDEVSVTNAARGEVRIVPPFRERRRKTTRAEFEPVRTAMFKKSDEDVIAVTRPSNVPGIIPAEDIRDEWPPFGPEYPGEAALVRMQPTGVEEARYDLLSDIVRMSDTTPIGSIGIALSIPVSMTPTAETVKATTEVKPTFWESLLKIGTEKLPTVAERYQTKLLAKATKPLAPTPTPVYTPALPAQAQPGLSTTSIVILAGVGVAAVGVLAFALMRR